MKVNKYMICATLALCWAVSNAGTVNVTFDVPDCKQVGVYDTWENSPFRTGALEGNIKVVTNHLADSVNPSSRMLGVQRSRFGSNTFGAEIMLDEAWKLTPEIQYVHVLLHKPVDSRVMLIGLGNRADRLGQSPRVEQFWVYPSNDVKAGEWVDAVFPVKANEGVDIYSLVVVPDVRYDCSEDFVAYIDEIEINSDMNPRTGSGDYRINIPGSTMVPRYDRVLRHIGLSGNDSIAVHNVRDARVPVYAGLVDGMFMAVPGQRVDPSVDYTGAWMHAYVYIDRDNDGIFSPGELVSYSLFADGKDTGKSSDGREYSSANNGFMSLIDPPAFTVPSDLAPGIYRMRYKVDWDNTDPGGDAAHIAQNGGAIADVLLNVHSDMVSVANDNRNGEVLTADGRSLDNLKVPFGQPLTVRMAPSNGFGYGGIRIVHGYNLDGTREIHGNTQFREVVIPASEFDSNHCFTVPGELVDGDLLIEGLFVSKVAPEK